MKVTVAIPMLNAAPYLSGCLGCIMSQTFKDYEIIVVMDSRCSDGTDSLLAADEYKGIRVIMQTDGNFQNGAKNIALDNARGEYIWFMDSDDLAVDTFLEEMVGIIEKNTCDVVVCNHFYSKKRAIPKIKDQQYQVKTYGGVAACNLVSEGLLPIPSWCKLFRTDFLRGMNIRFENKQFSEDYDHTMRAFMQSDAIAYYNKPLYVYYLHDMSCSVGYGDSITKRDLEIASSLIESVNKDSPEIYDQYCSSTVLHLLRSLTNTSRDGFRKMSNDPVISECLSHKTSKFNFEISLFRISPTLYYYLGRMARKIKYSSSVQLFDRDI